MFIWSKNTKIITDIEEKVISNGIAILKRDQEKVLAGVHPETGNIRLLKDESLETESYMLEI